MTDYMAHGHQRGEAMSETPWTEGWVKDGTDRWVQTFPDGVLVTLRKEPPRIVHARDGTRVMGVMDRWHVWPPGDDEDGCVFLEDAQRLAWQRHTPEGRAEAARFAAMNKAAVEEIEGQARELLGAVTTELPNVMWDGRLCAVTQNDGWVHLRDPGHAVRRYVLALETDDGPAAPVCGHCGKPAEAVGTPDTRCQDCLGGRKEPHHICQPCWVQLDHARRLGRAESQAESQERVERVGLEADGLHVRVAELEAEKALYAETWARRTEGETEREARWAERLRAAEAVADVRGGEWCAKNRAEGRGPCGACAWCCQQAKERAEAAEHRESVLRSLARTEEALTLKARAEKAEAELARWRGGELLAPGQHELREEAKKWAETERGLVQRAEKAEADVKACQEVYAAARQVVRAVDAGAVYQGSMHKALLRLAKAVGL